MEFLQYFGGVFEPISFALLLFGTVGGLILGATPGLSPTMAVALLIPFTFQLEAVQGLILLGAAYTSTVAGGAVSAILLKIPGAPANIATAIDGHEMAKQGEGAKALHLSFLASGIGGVFGVLLLIFLTPVLASWALAFGPSHLFWMAILGVTIIGTLDSKSFVKGLLSGCLGLWLSMIGYDDIQGAPRFVFSDTLTGGVNIITALIGIFAIPQVIDMFSKGRYLVGVEQIKVKQQSLLHSLNTLSQFGKATTIGTAIGSVIGLIPGVGGQIAGLVSYDQSKKFSKNPDRYGSGYPEGVIAAESANNAMVGPSLVPLLTLSIPGSPTAAVLLGGLLIHGIFPGSDLFENHPQVAWTFINSMLIGQILMVIFGIWVARFAVRVAQVPNAIMAAAVSVLALFGAYSVQQSMGDVYVMATLGIVMYFLERFGYSAAPLVLGLILGPIAESNFVQGSIIANATDGITRYFFTGALNSFLIALVMSSIAYSLLSTKMKASAQAEHISVDASSNTNNSRLQHLIPSTLVLLLAGSVAYLSFTSEPAGAFLFPRIISVVMLALAIWNFMRAAMGLAKIGSGITLTLIYTIVPGLLVSVIYVFFAAKFLGFYVGSFAAFLALFTLYDPASNRVMNTWIKRIIVSLLFMSVIYCLFSLILKVQTPQGLFF